MVSPLKKAKMEEELVVVNSTDEIELNTDKDPKNEEEDTPTGLQIEYEGKEETKILNDPVHGHIEMPPLCMKIVDTPQFQRLRHIKQLGACYHVFPGAAHNRFEHSIGVCYLAGELCQSLQKRQPELKITEEDTLCVQIAGLCHDLGHGPFSHMFDEIFIPKARPSQDKRWKHEDGSVSMFDHLIKENKLGVHFEKWKLKEIDIIFIKELIHGPRNNKESWPYKGRVEDKSFLYEVVANKRTGLDVDKFDYFSRDCYHLGIQNNVDYNRYMKFARVLVVEGRKQICTRDKEVYTLYDIFHTRNSLHRIAYQHKTGKIIDSMISEVLLKADEYLKIPGTNGKLVKMSDSIYDMVAYTKLTDNIIQHIAFSQDPNLKEAQKILRRIETRDLYKLVGHTILKTNYDEREPLLENILGESSRELLDPNDFFVHIINFNFGMEKRNPIDEVRFYQKNNPTVAHKLRKDQVSQMLPESFAEQQLRLYCKKREPVLIKEAKRALEEWCKQMECTPSKDGSMHRIEERSKCKRKIFDTP